MPPFNWFNRQQNKPASQSEPASPESKQPTPEEAATEKATEPTSAAPPAIDQDYLSWAKAAYQNIQKQKSVQTPQETSSATEPVAEGVTEVPGEVTEPIAVEQPSPEPVPEVSGEEAPSTPAEAAPTPEEPVSTPAAATLAEIASPESLPVEQPETLVVEPSEAIAATPDPSAAESPAPLPTAEVPVEPAQEETPETEVTSVATAAITSAEPQPETIPASAPAVAAAPAQPLPFWAKAEVERLERLERLKAEAPEEPSPTPVVATQATQPTPSASEESVESPDIQLDEGFLWSARVLAEQGRQADQIDLEEITWLKRLRQGLDKTRRTLVNQLKAVVGQGPLNQDAVSEIEALLLQADVGVEATDFIVESLQQKIRQEALPPEQAIAYLKEILRGMLDRPYEKYNPTFAPEKDTLNIWLITGVNGAGKTTTIGKIAHVATKSGYKTLIGAADTFRAAAVQQVKVWGDRSSVEVIANPGKNTDPAAVVFDAITAAQSRGTELLLIDTAGRLQNKKNLMDELGKIRRIIDKKAPDAKIESLLVLDSTLGQNGLRQAEVFSEVAQLSGVILTKLDGTAKGGIALAVVQQLGLPIRFIGAGEGIEDLRPFSSYEFVEALLSG